VARRSTPRGEKRDAPPDAPTLATESPPAEPEAASAAVEGGTPVPAGGPEGGAGPVRIRWDDRALRSTYVNACHVTSTREEVVLLLGLNQAWHSGQREIPVQLSHRLVLSPLAAKRVSLLLENVLREYESRFGGLA